MIDATEHVQLERIEEAGGDYYAQHLFLALWRMKVERRETGELADIIIGVTDDMNERVARRTGK